ncbi:MAG: hypothetical protein HOH66_18310 [Rhodospirillaceae bacterium]|nr:hypothetical protein [Rhodospirillaceae bacterium]MBT6119821.1 hypothetical protein [Rhodospirillaceae bacterium]
MSQSQGYKILVPPDDPRKKISWDPDLTLEAMQKRAESGMREIESDARTLLSRDLDDLDQALRLAIDAEASPAEELREVSVLANDIRTQAENFGFEAIASICAAMCTFISERPEVAAARKDVLKALVHAMKAVRPESGDHKSAKGDLELAGAVIAMVRKVGGA